MITQTTIKTTGNTLNVIRFLNGKLWKVEFDVNVLAKDLVQYFNVSDDLFKMLSRPVIGSL